MDTTPTLDSLLSSISPELDDIKLPLELSFKLEMLEETTLDTSIPVCGTQRNLVCFVQEIIYEALCKFTEFYSDSTNDNSNGLEVSTVFPEMLHIPLACLSRIWTGLNEISDTMPIQGLDTLKKVMDLAPAIQDYLVFFPQQFTLNYHTTNTHTQKIPYVPNPMVISRLSNDQRTVEFLLIIPKLAGDSPSLEYALIKHDGSVSIGDCRQEALHYSDNNATTSPIYVDRYDRNKRELSMLILQAEALTLRCDPEPEARPDGAETLDWIELPLRLQSKYSGKMPKKISNPKTQ